MLPKGNLPELVGNLVLYLVRNWESKRLNTVQKAALSAALDSSDSREDTSAWVKAPAEGWFAPYMVEMAVCEGVDAEMRSQKAKLLRNGAVLTIY